MTLESADTVYVYDYCYIMKQVADSSSQRHWLLKDVYNGTRGQGDVLLKLYRCACSLSPSQLHPCMRTPVRYKICFSRRKFTLSSCSVLVLSALYKLAACSGLQSGCWAFQALRPRLPYPETGLGHPYPEYDL